MTMVDTVPQGDSPDRLGGRSRKRLDGAPPAGLRIVRLHVDDGVVLVFSFPRTLPWPESLTAAERAVGELALDGMTNAEIARIRGTALRTVGNQMAALFRKVGARSRLELAARLLRSSSPGRSESGS